MTSVLNVDTIAAKNGTDPVTLEKQTAAKVYYKINQSTPATNDSFGLSSFTDTAAGNFTMTFTAAFDSAHFGVSGQSDNWHTYLGSVPTTTTVLQTAGTSGHSLADSIIYGTVHGDLA